jgi:hypothetical protein
MTKVTVQPELKFAPGSLAYLVSVAFENNMTLEDLMVEILEDCIVASLAIEARIAEQEAEQDNHEMNVDKRVEELVYHMGVDQKIDKKLSS